MFEQRICFLNNKEKGFWERIAEDLSSIVKLLFRQVFYNTAFQKIEDSLDDVFFKLSIFYYYPESLNLITKRGVRKEGYLIGSGPKGKLTSFDRSFLHSCSLIRWAHLRKL